MFLKGSIFYKIGTGDANTILVMENGAIAESGNHTDLLEQKGKYFDLWNKQRLV